MSQLSDVDIWKRLGNEELVIDPMPTVVQPASVDLHLDDIFIHPVRCLHIVTEAARYGTQITKALVMKPGSFWLASTIERVELPLDLIGRLEGKSSLGRLGLMVHVTAGFFDPGFRGHPTLELHNVTDRSIRLLYGMKICQMAFTQLLTPASKGYGGPGSKYQDQVRGPVGSRYHLNYEEGG